MQFNTIGEALEDLRHGKIILVTDDPDRENEGDFICAAEFATTENINFMATYGKGLICMPMSEAFVKMQRPRIFGDRDICFPSWQRKTACWSETAIRRPPLICAVWQA